MPTATPSSVPASIDAGKTDVGGTIAPWLIGSGVVLAMLAAAIGWQRRRRRSIDEAEIAPAIAASDLASLPPTPTAPPSGEEHEAPTAVTPAPAIRPAVELDFIVQRAGIRDGHAAVEFGIAIRNTGQATARAVSIQVRLTTAGPGQDAALAALHAQPIDRPMVAPFALEPGADAEFSATAVLPAEQINRLSMAGRPMFVPVIVLAASYRWEGGGVAELGVDYLLGVERPGQARLAPLWLDGMPEMVSGIGMRLHGPVRKR